MPDFSVLYEAQCGLRSVVAEGSVWGIWRKGKEEPLGPLGAAEGRETGWWGYRQLTIAPGWP